MDPEIGDKSIEVRREDVTAAARACGVVPGDTFVFHSSLSSMGTVVGSPDTVIDGLLDALGPTGTLAVPTLCRWPDGRRSETFEIWDPATSPSYIGAISEHFRKRPDAVRSDHATHSVAAIGARAEELTAGHGAADDAEAGLRIGPFGPHAFCAASPWERFVQWNAVYAFIGVDFRVNTMVHYVESMLVQQALAKAPEAERDALAAEVRGWEKDGVWPQLRIPDRKLFEDSLAAEGLVQCAKIGSATLRCARTRPMIDHWLTFLNADPARWLPEEYVAWAEKCTQSRE